MKKYVMIAALYVANMVALWLLMSWLSMEWAWYAFEADDDGIIIRFCWMLTALMTTGFTDALIYTAMARREKEK